MKSCPKITLVLISVFLFSAGMAAAQVRDDGDLAFTLANYQLNKPAAKDSELFVIRNRLDSGATWTASADAMIMSRSGGKSSTLLQTTGGSELFNSKDFIFPWAVGPRVGIVGEDILFGFDVEAGYFGIDGWSATKTILPEEDAFFRYFNEDKIPLYLGDVVNYYYISRLHSAEINLRYPIWERLSVLAGFRYLELHEDISGTINDLLYLEANVDNHLYGGQIGLAVAFINRPRFGIEGVIKAGVFGNDADLAMNVRDLGTIGDKIDHTAFLGEIGLTGIVQVTSHLSIRGGYQVMWLDGVAIAGDQVNSVSLDNAKPYLGGTLLYHGAFAGLEFAF